jgi:hypothetical protein
VTAEWTPYACKINPKGFDAVPCSKLTEVRHVVHVRTARRILEDGRIRAGLVYDESRLNTSRLSVAWLSANTWAYGSIYGNVEFVFDWDDLIKGRRLYWVEAMPQYSPPAYRFLLSDRDNPSPLVGAYDPASASGPLKVRDGEWYWNGNFTSEFMIESDVSLDDCRSVAFIEHNKILCRNLGAYCTDRKVSRERTGAILMAFVLGNQLHSADDALRNVAKGKLTYEAELGMMGIQLLLGGGTYKGALGKASADPIVKGALALLGAGNTPAAQALVSQLSDEKHMVTALEAVVSAHFGLKDYKLA